MLLLDEQKQAIDKLREYKIGALFMKAGTGKTLTAFNLIKSIDLSQILWFTPFNTKQNLQNEISKYGSFQNLKIMGIESVSNSSRIYLECLDFVQKKPTFLVCDESLKIKNNEAKRSKRLLDIAGFCEYKLLLNGTPIAKNLLDLWTQMQFLSPNLLKMDYLQFKNTFCEYTTITKSLGKQYYKKEFITAYHNIDYLWSLIERYVYECDLNLAINKHYFEHTYSLTAEIEEEYQKLKEKYLDNEMLMFKNNNIFLEMTQKMQNLYCCTAEKFDIVDMLLKQKPKDKVIIFYKFIDSREALEERYPDITLCSYQKHSLGLNLQDKNIIIFWDKTWDYATREQAEHRIYRKGQEKACEYHDLTGYIGLENLIKDNVDRKTKMLDYLKLKNLKEVL